MVNTLIKFSDERMVDVHMEIYDGTYCVYAHINMVNEKMYIGQTIHGDNPNRRWDNGNGYKHSPHFYAAIKKYGWDAFQHEIIASNLTSDEANAFEKLLISELDTTNPSKGYNVLPGGDNTTLPNIVKDKIRVKAIERFQDKTNHPLYGRVGELAPMYGKHQTDETKKKISDGNKGKVIPFEVRKKQSEAAKKRFESQVERDRISASSLGRKHTDEDRRKMRENSSVKIPVYSPELQMSFDSQTIAAEYVGIPSTYICRVLRGKRKHAGRHPVTGELLSWQEIKMEVIAE